MMSKKWKMRIVCRVVAMVLILAMIIMTACGREGEQESWANGVADQDISVKDAPGQDISDQAATQKEASEKETSKKETSKNEQNIAGDEEKENETKYPQITRLGDKWVDFAMESEGVYCIYVDGVYTFLTDTLEEITPWHYREASPFSEGLACVYTDGKYGYINMSGETALDFIYDYAAPFSEGLAYFAIGEKYGFMNAGGQAVFYLDCDSVSSFREGLAYFSMDGKYGYIDQTGAEVIAPVYDNADYFQDGLAVVRVGGYYGVIDPVGREVLPAIYKKIHIDKGFILVQDQNGQDICFESIESGSAHRLQETENADLDWGTGRTLLGSEAVGPAAEIDGAILKNVITPKIPSFYKMFL